MTARRNASRYRVRRTVRAPARRAAARPPVTPGVPPRAVSSAIVVVLPRGPPPRRWSSWRTDRSSCRTTRSLAGHGNVTPSRVSGGPGGAVCARESDSGDRRQRPRHHGPEPRTEPGAPRAHRGAAQPDREAHPGPRGELLRRGDLRALGVGRGVRAVPRAAPPDHPHGPGRQGHRRRDRRVHAPARAGRRHHRRRQRALRRHPAPREGPLGHGPQLRRRWASRAARRAPSTGPRSCPAARRRPTRASARCSRTSRPRSTASRAAPTSATTARATSSRWCTTASSTPTCSSSPRPTTCSARASGWTRPRSRRRSPAGTTGGSTPTSSRSPPRCSRTPTPTPGKPFVDVVADEAEQKGTGRWTVQAALDLGVPVTGIAEATFARSLSGNRTLRDAAKDLPGVSGARLEGAAAEGFADDIEQALYASKIVAYAQGFNEIQAGAERVRLDDRPRRRSRASGAAAASSARKFLEEITAAYEREPELTTLLTDSSFVEAIGGAQDSWRRVVASAAQLGIPTPGFSSALAYYDGIRADRLPAALVQGQRDFFGAHTYRRTDREGTFHTAWATDDRAESEA